MIAGVLFEGTAAPRTNTWTNVVEDYDATSEANETYSSGHKVFNGTQTALAITATASDSIQREALVIASFAPL